MSRPRAFLRPAELFDRVEDVAVRVKHSSLDEGRERKLVGTGRVIGKADHDLCADQSRVDGESAPAGRRIVDLVNPKKEPPMSKPRLVPSVASIALLAAGSIAWAAGRSDSDGFTPLFNGKDFTGWTVPEGDGGHWKVVDGLIDYDAQSEAKGDKNLWTEREYGDFVLRLDWRLKEAPFINKNVPYILPDGTHARDVHGKEIKLALPDADSGVYLRGDGQCQVNIWCWPIGSGEVYSVRMDPKTSPEVRAAVTPRHQADKPVGEWNHFEITVKGKTVDVELNGVKVLDHATIPDIPTKGRLALQHHGGKNSAGEWAGPPSLVQFRNIQIKELK